MLNYSDLARDAGIAPNTARKWLGVLQSSLIVALIEPYRANCTTRLIKAPKLIFLDTGLAAFLAGFRSGADLFASPYAGAFWESHVIGQVIRHSAARGENHTPMYWRTASGREVDLVLEHGGGQVVAIECKYKARPDSSDAVGLQALQRTAPTHVTETIIACRTPTRYRLSDGTWAMGVADVLERLT